MLHFWGRGLKRSALFLKIDYRAFKGVKMKGKIKKFFDSILFDKICFFITYFLVFGFICYLWVNNRFFEISTILFLIFFIHIIQLYYIIYILLPRQKQKIGKYAIELEKMQLENGGKND